jgi:hypothetical protein
MKMSLLSLVCITGIGCVSADAPSSLTFLPDNREERAQTVEEIQEICLSAELVTKDLMVSFPAVEPGCGWGQNNNLNAQQGVVTGRSEQLGQLDMPAAGVICDLAFQFESLDPSFSQTIIYDDNFLLTFNDVVLAASYGPMVDLFEEVDGMRRYDWTRLRGYRFGFGQVKSYCAGEEEGLGECTIPPPETQGKMSLNFGGPLIDKLSLLAIQEGRYDFSFITTGDNDPATDCSHAAFALQMKVTFAP